MPSISEILMDSENPMFDVCVAYHAYIGHTRKSLEALTLSGAYSDCSIPSDLSSGSLSHSVAGPYSESSVLRSFFSRAGALFKHSSGDQASSVDSQFLVQVADSIAQIPPPDIPDFIEDLLSCRIQMFVPRLKSDMVSSHKHLGNDVFAMKSGVEDGIINSYSVVERSALQLLADGELNVADVNSINDQYSSLKRMGIISDEKLASRQTSSVRWSITCAVFVDGRRRFICTGLCVGLVVAKLIVLIRMGNLPIKKISKARRVRNKSCICDVGKLVYKYAEAKKLIREGGQLSLERPSIVNEALGLERLINVSDAPSFIAFKSIVSRALTDPHAEYSLLRTKLLPPLATSAVYGVPAGNVVADYDCSDPSLAITQLVVNRCVLQGVRERLNCPGLNKSACLGLDVDLLPSYANERETTMQKEFSRATIRVSSMFSDAINLLRMQREDWRELTVVINWSEAFDLTVVFAIATLLEINCAAIVGSVETTSIGVLNGDARSFVVSSKSVGDSVEDRSISVERIARSMVSQGANGDLVLLCGGSTQDSSQAEMTWKRANSIVFDALAHNDHVTEDGLDIPLVEHLFVDFLLPDACRHLCSDRFMFSSEIVNPNSCEQCATVGSLSQDFDTTLRSRSVALVKPRYGFSHNCHVAYRFSRSTQDDIESAMELTNLTRKAILISDAWRMARDGSEMQGAGKGVSPLHDACEKAKLDKNRELRRQIMDIKSGPIKDAQRSEVHTMINPGDSESEGSEATPDDDDEDWY